jgi:rubrerythrin
MTEQNQQNEVQIVEASAIESMERALVDTQVATAKRYPRPPFSQIRDNMLSLVTLDEETAASCFFTLPRGGKAIQGESIRMAEIAASQYQNLRIRTRIIAMVTTGDAPYVVVQGEAYDLEKNFGSSIEKRRRIIKKKFKDAIDEDDINLAVNACSAIAYRDTTFKVIPKALIRPVFEAAKKVAIGDIRSLVAKRTEVIDRLNKMGAPLDRILAVIEVPTIDDITVEKLQQLIGLGTALKDGETTLEDAFPPIRPPEKLGVAGLQEKIKNNADVNNEMARAKERKEVDDRFNASMDKTAKSTPPKRGRPPKAKDEPPAETSKNANDLRPQWYCDACNQVFAEPKYDGKVIICPLCGVKADCHKATEQNYRDAGYTETK